MGYAAAPRVAFIVYGIQTFFTAIIIIIKKGYNNNNNNINNNKERLYGYNEGAMGQLRICRA